ncbi:MAG TPA: lycopene cyclase domain-containing protein, partial [Solirubrobacterales bacterium]
MLGQATYLAFLLPWAGAVVLLHWLIGAPELRARLRWVALATLLSTAYLAAADRFALGDGIWTISPAHSTGIHVLGLPLEEGLFFLLTNLMVAQSVALLAAPELTPGVAWARARAHARRVAAFAADFAAAWPVGAAAASLSALVGSVLAVALGAPPALDAPWQLIMVWTPVPVAAWLIDTLGDLSRPLGLIGAFAVYLLVGGVVGTLARLRRWLILAVAAVCLWLWLAGPTHPLAAAALALGPLAAALVRGERPNPMSPFPVREGATTDGEHAGVLPLLPPGEAERRGARVRAVAVPVESVAESVDRVGPDPNPLPEGEWKGDHPVAGQARHLRAWAPSVVP